MYESDKMLRNPIYFLYFHAIELALKAFLRVADIPIVSDGKRKHHQITELYEECRELGLKVGPNDALDFRNVVTLMDGANKEQAFRYFEKGGSGMPELSWTRDAVENLLQAVEPSVKKKAKADGIVPGVAVKFDIVFAKPPRQD